MLELEGRIKTEELIESARVRGSNKDGRIRIESARLELEGRIKTEELE